MTPGTWVIFFFISKKRMFQIYITTDPVTFSLYQVNYKDMLHWYELWLTSFYVTTFEISLLGFDTVYNVFKWIIIKPLTYLSIWNIYNMLSQEVSPCDSSPCPNNMTCVRDGANYTCQCMAGFTGLNCENGKVLNWTRQYTTLHIQTTKLSSIIDALKSCKHYDLRIALL